MKRLEGKVSVITGATGGIGEASVRLFAKEGAKVVATDIEDERGMRLESDLDNVIYRHADVAVEDEVRNAVRTAIDEWGRLDVMFNNAGISGVQGSIEGIGVEEFDRTINVNLRGAFLGIKHATPWMRRQGSGSIISTASTASFFAGASQHAYSASKAGIVQLTRNVSTELGESGIRVNCISPGCIPTPMIGMSRANLTRDQAENRIRVIEDEFSDAQPLRGPIMPTEIAKAALFLASDDSRFITGQNLVVDGGFTVGRTWREFQGGYSRLRKALTTE